jgi:hypothetical protein
LGITLVLLAAWTARAADEVPDPLPYEATLRDPVFAVLVGLITRDVEGQLSGAHLQAEIERRKQKSLLPADLLVSLERRKTGPSSAAVVLQLRQPMNRPIPYSILWYRPGAMQASADTVYTEHVLGRLSVPHVVKGRPPRALDVAGAHLFLLERGGLAVDIDGWLDKLMGASLDDTDVDTFALVSYQGRWYGLAIGRNPSGEARQGAFDMNADKVLFPIPAEVRSIIRMARGRARALRQAAGAR